MLYSNYNIVLPSLTINRLQIRTMLCYLEKESDSKIKIFEKLTLSDYSHIYIILFLLYVNLLL